MPTRYDIVPQGSGWAVKSNGTVRKRTSTKQAAKRWVRNNAAVGASVWLHNSDGKIQREFTITGG